MLGAVMCLETKGAARRGFTLIEILAVVVVIVILAALSVPMISRAKNAARATRCINNLRQIGLAFGSYAADHDGKDPPVVEAENEEESNESVWSNILITQNYLADPGGQSTRNVFLCPFDPFASVE